MKTSKRFLALFLAFLMAFGSFPTAVVAAGEEEIVSAPEAAAEPAPAEEPAPEAAAEPATVEPAPEVQAPAEEPAPEVTAEPVPEATAEPVLVTAEPVPVATEVPAPEADGYANEYSSTPVSYTVTWKMTVAGGVIPDIEDQFAPGALLTPPEEAAQYEAQGYELTYYLDEYRTQKVDFDVDYVYVNADMTVWVDGVLPTPVPVEQQPAAEPDQSAPEADAPAADLGVGGFQLPGVEVPEVPETEIIAPEPQADANTNADNGIAPIAESNESVRMTLDKITDGTEFEVGDKITYRLTAENIRRGILFGVPLWIDDLYLTIPNVTGFETDRVDVPSGSNYTTEADGWHIQDIPANGIVVIEFSYTITEADVARGETLTVTVESRTGRGERADASESVHIALKKTVLSVVITPEQAKYTYDGTQHTASTFTYEVQGARVSDPKSLVTVEWKNAKSVSGTDANVYTAAVTKDDFTVSVKNDRVYKLADDGVTVNGDLSLTIDKANVTLKAADGSKVYDGEPLTKDDWSIVPGDQKFRDEIATNYTVTVSGEQTGFGSSDNTLTVAEAGAGPHNFNITTQKGTLNVSKRPVTVEVKPVSDVYVEDASPVSVELVGRPAGLVDGHVLTLTGATGTVDTLEEGSKDITGVTGNVTITAGDQDVTANYDITFTGTATVKALHTITVNVTGGTADPTGEVKVHNNGELAITFTADPGNALESAKLDGADIELTKNADGTYSYTISGVVENHTIDVVFSADSDGDGKPDATETNDITVSVTGGTADPAESPIKVKYGEDQAITFTPDKYYTLGTVMVNGEPAALDEGGSYTFTNVIDNATIEVVFVLDTYTVTLHDGETVTSEDVTAGESFTPETPAPRADVLFSGWATEADGDAVYAPGQSFTVEGDTDIYAVWTAKTPKTYRAYVDISGLPAVADTVREIFKHTDPEPSMSFNLYVKLAGTDAYVQKQSVNLQFSNCTIEIRGTNARVYWVFSGYEEDAYQIGEFAYANIKFVGDPEVGEYRTRGSSSYNFHYNVKTSGDTLFGNIYYEVNPTYDVTLQLKKWTVEDSSKSVIKEVVKSGFHEDDPYDFTAEAPAQFDYEGHHYIAINEGGSVLTGKAPMSIPLVRYYATDDNRDNVPDVCQTIITYKVENGAWNDGTTEDKKIEYRFYELKNGKWERRSEVKFPGGWLAIETPGVGEKPNDGYAEGSWDTTPPTELKWLFSGDAGKFDKVYTYTYEKQYTVTYTDGVDEEAFPNQEHKATVGSATPAFVGEPTREGYEFAGWEPAVADTVTEDATYVAQWKAYTSLTATIHNHFSNKKAEALKQRLWYTITDAAGEVVVARTEVPQNTAYPWGLTGATAEYGGMDSYYTDGVVVTVPIQLEKALPAGKYTINYELTGWEKGLSTVSGLFIFLDERTLTHTFTVQEGGEAAIDAGKVETWEYWYELKFDGNGGTPVPATMYAPCDQFDDVDTGYVTNKINKFTIPDTVPQKPGYVFIGWTLGVPDDYGKNGENGLSLMAAPKVTPTPDPNKILHQPGETITVTRGTSIGGYSCTLYANWVKQYTVTYTDGVDGEVIFPDQSYPVKSGDNAPAFVGTPEREHYNFIGWATKQGGEVVYKPGAVIKVTGDLTLYAVWTYNQVFNAYVGGLYLDEVQSDAFKLSCTLTFSDGTEIKLDKADAANIKWQGAPSSVGPTWTDIAMNWTVELPASVVGSTVTVNLVKQYAGYVIEDNYKGTTHLNTSPMPEPGKTEISAMSVEVRAVTSYYPAEGGTISSTAPAWTTNDYVGQYRWPTHIAEYSMPHKDPVGATAVADPGYVFKGWYACNESGVPTSTEPVATEATLTAADMVHVNNTTVQSNQQFVPKFEKAEMVVKEVNEEYRFETFYPTVTFTGADGLKAEDLGLTIQYSEDGNAWANERIGIMHVADSRTIYVRAVDSEGNEVFAERPVELKVTPHKVTLKSKDATYYYTTYATAERSMVAGYDDNDQFYELMGQSYGVIGFNEDTCIDAGFYKDAGKFTVGWYPDQPSGRPGVYASDYEVETEFGDMTILPRLVTVKQTETVPYTGETQSLVVDITGTTYDKGAYKPAQGIYHDEKLNATLSALQPGTYTVTTDEEGNVVVKGDGAEFTYQVLKKDGVTDSTKNYDITFELTLIIETVDVNTLTVENPADLVYDATAKVPVVKAGDKVLVDGVDYTITYNNDNVNYTGKDVTATITGIGGYTGTVKTSYRIQRRSIGYTSSATKVYNGQEQSAALDIDTMTYYDGHPLKNYYELVEGHRFTYINPETIKVSLTRVGTKNGGPNAPYISYGSDVRNFTIVDAKDNDVSNNYYLCSDIHFTITPAPLTVRAVDNNKVYGTDDPELTWEVVDGTLYERDKDVTHIIFSVTREEGEEVGEYDMTVSFEYPNPKTNKEKNYTVTCLPGTFEITKADAAYAFNVSTPESYVYDGTAHQWTPTVTDSRTDEPLTVGTDYRVEYDTNDFVSAGTITVTITGLNNYSGNVSTTFTIAKAEVTVTAENKSITYGDALPELTATDNKPADGVDVNYTLGYAEGVTPEAAGTYEIVVSVGENPNYDVTPVSGTLTITEKNVDLTDPASDITMTAPAGTTYNGQAQEQKPAIRDGEKTLVEGVDYDLSYENNINAGTATVTVTFKGNYSGTASTTFDIARAAVTVTAENKSITYGDDLPALTATDNKPAGGVDVNYTLGYAEGVTPAAAGTYEIVVSEGENPNYDVTVVNGTLTITAKGYDPASGITASAPGDVTYNGTSQQQRPVVTDGSTVLTEGVDYTLSYSADTTNAGAVTVTVNFQNNYSGSVSRTYNIVPAVLTVSTGSATRMYNGAALTAGGTVRGLVNGETASVNVTSSITNQGTEPNDDYTIAWGTAAARNYTVSAGTMGTLTVTARPVTLTSGSGAKVYDGTPLTNGTVTVGGQGFVAGQGASYTFTGSQTDAGSSANTFTYALNANTLARNYAITTVTGTLTVTAAAAASMSVDTPANALYDGTAHQWAPTVTGVGGAALTAGADYTVSYSTTDFVNAGAVTVTVTGIGNYAGISYNRYYRITPRTVTLTSASDTKAYDGTALANATVTAGGDGFVRGQGASFNVTGRQTAVGSSRNTFTYTLNAGANEDNYNILPIYGTLTVTAAAAASMSVDTPANALYDGTAHQWAPTVTGVGGAALTAGVDYTVSYSTTDFVNAGAVTVTVTGIGNYAGISYNRYYRITPRTVTLTSANATRAYNGNALTNTTVTVGGDGFVRGQGVSFNVTGRRTAVGTSQNTFTYAFNTGTNADNYNILTIYGTLTVTAAPTAPAENQPDADDDDTNVPGGPVAGPDDDGNGPDNGANGPDNGNDVEINEDETPLGQTPEDEAAGNEAGEDADGEDADGEDEAAEDEAAEGEEPEDVPEEGPDYTLSEEAVITEDETPLAGAPTMQEQECCILHFILMLGALAVAVYYTYDRKKRQEREFELRSEL